MHGTVYKIEKSQKKKVEIFASFGGLLMKISGSEENLKKFINDSVIYILIMKV